MEQNAPALSIQFDANAAAELHYLIAVHRAQALLGIDQLPPLILKRWPPLHIFGPSASAAILCAVVSLFTNRLCRSDTAVTARVEFGTDELFGVGFLAQKAWGAREADLTRLVMSTADQDAWAAVPADVREGLTPVFVGTGRELLDAMFKPLPCAVHFICDDCWLLVFDFLTPSQLGLEIALISRRFDFYVDEHFKTRKWKLNKQLLIQWDVQENGTKQMQIVKSDGNPLPIPQNPLPNKVIGFRRIQIIYIDQNVIAFFRRFHRFFRCLYNGFVH
ncbi:hypothetical protein niasHT_018871 [Heterodera trifolii]|uniref:Lon proteolytic domain-containing protein n=1 Tax=Heterodera trifolii TaxID=157864 RepID=A0ABD2L527_9BILA